MRNEAKWKTRHFLPYIFALLLRYQYVIGFVGFGVGYYLHATLGFDKFVSIVKFDLLTVAFSALSIPITIQVFYAESLDKHKKKFGPGQIVIPDTSNFYPQITSDIGCRRVCTGYIFGAANTSFFLSLGVALSMILGHGPLPVFW